MEYESEISLADLFLIFRRGLGFAVAVAVGAAAVTFALSKRVNAEYDSTVTLLASKPSSAQSPFDVSLVTAPAIDTNAYHAAAKSYPVLSSALIKLGEAAPPPRRWLGASPS